MRGSHRSVVQDRVRSLVQLNPPGQLAVNVAILGDDETTSNVVPENVQGSGHHRDGRLADGDCLDGVDMPEGSAMNLELARRPGYENPAHGLVRPRCAQCSLKAIENCPPRIGHGAASLSSSQAACIS